MFSFDGIHIVGVLNNHKNIAKGHVKHAKALQLTDCIVTDSIYFEMKLKVLNQLSSGVLFLNIAFIQMGGKNGSEFSNREYRDLRIHCRFLEILSFLLSFCHFSRVLVISLWVFVISLEFPSFLLSFLHLLSIFNISPQFSYTF